MKISSVANRGRRPHRIPAAVHMIGRRDFLLGAAAVPLAAATPYLGAAPQDALAFRILRNGSEIGSHALDFTAQNDGFDVRIAVDIKVGLGPITLYRYRLRGVERWRNGAVASAEATTDDDGDKRTMRCQSRDGGLWVEGSKTAPYRAPDGALPASHWNIAELHSPWISLEDGRLFRPVAKSTGMDNLRQVDGTTTEAKRYVLSGDVHLELWYDLERRWASLAFTAHDGSSIRYERLS